MFEQVVSDAVDPCPPLLHESFGSRANIAPVRGCHRPVIMQNVDQLTDYLEVGALVHELPIAGSGFFPVRAWITVTHRQRSSERHYDPIFKTLALVGAQIRPSQVSVPDRQLVPDHATLALVVRHNGNATDPKTEHMSNDRVTSLMVRDFGVPHFSAPAFCAAFCRRPRVIATTLPCGLTIV